MPATTHIGLVLENVWAWGGWNFVNGALGTKSPSICQPGLPERTQLLRTSTRDVQPQIIGGKLRPGEGLRDALPLYGSVHDRCPHRSSLPKPFQFWPKSGKSWSNTELAEKYAKKSLEERAHRCVPLRVYKAATSGFRIDRKEYRRLVEPCSCRQRGDKNEDKNVNT